MLLWSGPSTSLVLVHVHVLIRICILVSLVCCAVSVGL